MPGKILITAFLLLVTGSGLSTRFLPPNEFILAPAGEAAYKLSTNIAPKVKILFTGDLFFDRHIREVIYKKGADYVFSCIDGLLNSADLAVGNLEGPITKSISISRGTEPGTPDNYRFTFAENIAAVLAGHNFKIVNLGNNHIGNFGLEGIMSTKRLLSAEKVGFFGGLSGDEPVYRFEKNGINLSFISYNEFGGAVPGKVAEKIKHEKAEGRTVIIYAHWGEEYSADISKIEWKAKILADSGASLIIGSHPHIVLPRGQIGGTVVYYSLGNFIFDQYWNDKVSNGLAVMAYISPVGIDLEEYPVKIERDGRTCPAAP